MVKFNFNLVGSLEKVLPSRNPVPLEKDAELTGLYGEVLSFQLAYHCASKDYNINHHYFKLQVSSSLKGSIKLRKVEFVPCSFPSYGVWDDNYLTTEPGLLPDLLTPIDEDAPVKAIPNQWRALWIDVTLDASHTEEAYPITIRTEDRNGELLWEDRITIRPVQRKLPEQKLLHTEWLHADCLADYYRVPVFSEEHWRIIDYFMESAASHGINMMLTPIFTPPLDTAIGGERTTVQLIDVEKKDGQYHFDFGKLERWIGLCKKHRIKNIEIAHLFTQWGAEAGPKVMAKVDGREERIFGWDTPATGGEYTVFLHRFLPELKGFLKEQGVFDDTWFHISDEPHDYSKATYAAAKATVEELLSDCKVIDALSSYQIYKEGIVEKPIASIDEIQPFIDGGVPNLWAYHCCVQALEVSNRFIAMPSARNRILGVLFYLYQIEGFLHWGFNFYNSQYSLKAINPYLVTDAGEAFPSGDPFLVYPAEDGTAHESIRGMVLKEALYDLRALEYLDSLIGRAEVEKLICEGVSETITFTNYPTDPDYIIQLRRKINEKIKDN